MKLPLLSAAVLVAAGGDVRRTPTRSAPGRAGIAWVPLWITPRVQLKDAGVDTNVFQTRDQPTRDAVAVVSPRLDGSMKIGRRLRATGFGYLDLNYYRRQGEESSTDFYGEGDADARPGSVRAAGRRRRRAVQPALLDRRRRAAAAAGEARLRGPALAAVAPRLRDGDRARRGLHVRAGHAPAGGRHQGSDGPQHADRRPRAAVRDHEQDDRGRHRRGAGGPLLQPAARRAAAAAPIAPLPGRLRARSARRRQREADGGRARLPGDARRRQPAVPRPGGGRRPDAAPAGALAAARRGRARRPLRVQPGRDRPPALPQRVRVGALRGPGPRRPAAASRGPGVGRLRGRPLPAAVPVSRRDAAWPDRRDHRYTAGVGLARRFGDSVRIGGHVSWARRVSTLPLFSYEGLRYGLDAEVLP